MNEIIFIMGKSSTGKDTIFGQLLQDKDMGLKGVVLYTTRPIRSGETNGVEYNFVSDERADELLKTGKVIEMRTYQTVYGPWRYFTADDGQINLKSGERYIVIGTLEAYSDFVKYFGQEHILPIYIEVDDGIRLQRALDRERQQEKPKYAELCRRFLADCQDFSEEKIKAAGIDRRFYNNGDIKECIEAIKKM
ncbi:MAG: guanylate kinase [Lachnospiraceae bacterium]